MICPIMSFRKQCLNEANCREEKCAWWNKNCSKCAIATLAENSGLIDKPQQIKEQ